MNDDLKTLYGLVRRTRAGVLDWLDSLPSGVLTRERYDFAFGSLDGIYTHIADCYLHWVENVGLGRERRWLEGGSVPALRSAFAIVDEVVVEALALFTDPDEPIRWTSPEGYEEVLSGRWLIAHPITHEFHHKGQSLALARVLGFPHPGRPDTDLVPPFP
ncbi:MAG TPA: DinB family protein [Trueperaceae bacterium]